MHPGNASAGLRRRSRNRDELLAEIGAEEIELLAIKGLQQEKVTGQLLDIISGKRLGALPSSGRLTIELPALTARTIAIEKHH